MEIVLIDTSGLYALRNETDKFHQKSIEIFQKSGNSGDSGFLITNFILCEFLNLVNIRKNHVFAVKCLEFIQKSSIIHLERINHVIENEGIKFFKEYTKEGYSFTDCTSFAFMKAFGIKKAFAFDTHFQQFGFELLK